MIQPEHSVRMEEEEKMIRRTREEEEGRGMISRNTCWKLMLKEVAPRVGLRTTLLKDTAGTVRVAAPCVLFSISPPLRSSFSSPLCFTSPHSHSLPHLFSSIQTCKQYLSEDQDNYK